MTGIDEQIDMGGIERKLKVERWEAGMMLRERQAEGDAGVPCGYTAAHSERKERGQQSSRRTGEGEEVRELTVERKGRDEAHSKTMQDAISQKKR